MKCACWYRYHEHFDIQCVQFVKRQPFVMLEPHVLGLIFVTGVATEAAAWLRKSPAEIVPNFMSAYLMSSSR